MVETDNMMGSLCGLISKALFVLHVADSVWEGSVAVMLVVEEAGHFLMRL